MQASPVVNLLLLGFAAPAAVFWIGARRFTSLHWEPYRDYMIGLACVLLFANGTLEMRRLFQGETITLKHATLAELYTTTLAWFALGLLTFGLWRIQRERTAGLGAAIMLATALVSVLAGHGLIYNPLFNRCSRYRMGGLEHSHPRFRSSGRNFAAVG